MNLIVKYMDREIFSNDGKWLHPLFALEDFLKTGSYPVNKLQLIDKIIGRGAAVLIAKMEIKNIHGKLLSKKAIPILEDNNINFTYDTLVDQITCKTEIILTDDMDLQQCYIELARRAGRN